MDRLYLSINTRPPRTFNQPPLRGISLSDTQIARLLTDRVRQEVLSSPSKCPALHLISWVNRCSIDKPLEDCSTSAEGIESD